MLSESSGRPLRRLPSPEVHRSTLADHLMLHTEEINLDTLEREVKTLTKQNLARAKEVPPGEPMDGAVVGGQLELDVSPRLSPLFRCCPPSKLDTFSLYQEYLRDILH